jgi:hypothetical protein
MTEGGVRERSGGRGGRAERRGVVDARSAGWMERGTARALAGRAGLSSLT